MRKVNISEAKAQLSWLIAQAEKGEEIIISKAGKPVVRLVIFQPNTAPRVPGGWKGKVQIAPDFDATPAEILKSFYEAPLFPAP